MTETLQPGRGCARIETATPDDDGESHAGPGPMRIVTPGYFSTLGIELQAGRDFAAADRTDSPAVIILDVVTFAGVAAVAAGVAALASWLPARRAAVVDPVVAIRG